MGWRATEGVTVGQRVRERLASCCVEKEWEKDKRKRKEKLVKGSGRSGNRLGKEWRKKEIRVGPIYVSCVMVREESRARAHADHKFRLDFCAAIQLWKDMMAVGKSNPNPISHKLFY